MQLESKHILRRAGKAAKLFLFSFTALLTLLPQSAHADDPMSNPGMRKLMMTIAMLNFAMQQAAENPMDQWRRQNVAQMMGMMPIAIAGLAKEFQSNKLVDSQLPMVQAMLGGFIDKNVGDRYTAFAKNPSKNLIPQVGKSFPADIMKQGASAAASAPAGSATLKFNENAKAGQPADDSTTKSINDEIANLGAVATEMKAEPMTDAGAKRDSATLTFDESAKGGASDLMPSTSGERNNAPVFSGSASGSGFSGELSRDLSSVESNLGYSEGLTVKKIEKKDSAFEEDLAPIKDGTKSKTRNRPGRRESQYRTKLNSNYYSVRSLMEVSLGLYPFAEAAGSCGGGGQGESGAKSAELLFGLAAMMAAVAPMVAAAVQASADKDIAKTNANAQMAMTKMTADTSKYLADQQKNVALQQAEIAAKISNDNQQATTQRLTMQLSALKQARDTTAAQDKEKFAYQQQLDQQRIALAKQQSDETIRLANTQLRAQMTQAGISQGFVRSMNSATGLTVNGGSATFQSGQPGGYGQVAANTSAGGTGVIASNPNQGFTGSSAIFGATNSNTNTANTQGRLAVNTRKAVASSTLLGNLEPVEEQGVVGKWVRDSKTGKLVFVPATRGSASRLAVKRVTNTTTASRSAVMPTQASVGLALKGVMTTNSTVTGSSAQTKVKTEAPVAATAAILNPGPNTSQSFADYLNAGDAQAATRRAIVTTTTAPSQPSSHSGAYAEPDMSQLDRGLMKSPRRDRTVN